MQHKITALALVGLAGVTLAGCGVQHHASSTQHHATPTKKVAQKNKTGNSIALSSRQAAQTSSSSDQGKQFAFPQNMQGTWYGVDPFDGKMHTLVIKGNQLTEDGHTLQCMTMKAWTPEDESIINNPQEAQNTWKQARPSGWMRRATGGLTFVAGTSQRVTVNRTALTRKT